MYKLFGAGLIVLGCGGCGFSIARSCKLEQRYLHQLLNMLQIMQNELSCRYTPLPELFRIAAGNGKDHLSSAMAAMATELERQISPDAAGCMEAVLQDAAGIPAPCRELLSCLGRSLGCFDLEGQLQQLGTVTAECERLLRQRSADMDTRIRNYQTLGLCAGAALAILLL